MKIAVTAAVLLAVVSTAVVTVCQHSETRHLEYRVWQLERRRERLERDRRRLEAALSATRTPRRLLGAPPPQDGPAPIRSFGTPVAPRTPTAATVPPGFQLGDNFEGGER